MYHIGWHGQLGIILTNPFIGSLNPKCPSHPNVPHRMAWTTWDYPNKSLHWQIPSVHPIPMYHIEWHGQLGIILTNPFIGSLNPKYPSHPNVPHRMAWTIWDYPNKSLHWQFKSQVSIPSQRTT